MIAGIGQTENHELTTKGSRFILDANHLEYVNSQTEKVDGYSVEGRALSPAQPHGAIWRATVPRTRDQKDIVDALRRPYTEQEFTQLKAVALDPWVAAYKQAMNAAHSQHGFAVSLEVHTFPSNVAGGIRTPGKYQGGFALGPKSQMAEVNNVQDLMAGKMPGVFVITNFDHEAGVPRSCHPIILNIIKTAFEAEGYPVSNGFGPLQGEYGSTEMYSNLEKNFHVAGIEIIDHKITPGKTDGSVEYDKDEAEKLAAIMRTIYEQVAKLTAADLMSS